MLQGTRYRIAEEPVAHIDYDTFHVHGLLSGLCLAAWMQNVLLYQGYHTPRLRMGHKGQNCEIFSVFCPKFSSIFGAFHNLALLGAKCA